MAGLFDALIPTNARIFLDTLSGNTKTITESDFSKEELDVLRSIYKETKKKNKTAEQELIKKAAITEKEYNKNPETSLVEVPNSYGGFTMEQQTLPYSQFIKKVNTDLDTYTKTRNKTSVGYYDYPDGNGAPTFDSWLDAITKSYSDPVYRMKTVLGSFNVMDTKEGPKIVDNYNFDKRDFYQKYQNVDFNKDSLATMWEKSNGPIDFLDMMMIKHRPQTSREVSVNLNYQDPFGDTTK